MKFWVLHTYRTFAGHDTQRMVRGEDGKILAFPSRETAQIYRNEHFSNRLMQNGPFVDMRDGKLTAKYRMVN